MNEAFRRLIVLALPYFVAACGDEATSHAPNAVSASVSASVATVVNVSWTTAGASRGYVLYGRTQSLGENTALENASGTRHSQVLLGLSADTTYYYRVVTWDGHDAGRSEIMQVHTAPLPSAVPSFSVKSDASAEYPFEQLMLVPVVGNDTVITLLNPSGEVVWYHVEESDRAVTRARFSRDGMSVLYNAIDADEPSDSALVRVALDGSDADAIKVPDLGQDFVELLDGTFAAITSDTRDHDGTMLEGARIVEVSASGAIDEVWSTWDDFDPDDSPGDEADGDWASANALVLDDGSESDATDDRYFVGLRNLSSIVAVDRATGDVAWTLGDAGTSAPTLEFADDSPAFKHPGQFEVSKRDLLVLDADGDPDSARVLTYDLDLDEATATLATSYTPTPALHVSALGKPTSFSHDQTFVNWSTAGRLELAQLSDDGSSKIVWSLTAPNVTFGYHALTKTDSLYEPKDPE